MNRIRRKAVAGAMLVMMPMLFSIHSGAVMAQDKAPDATFTLSGSSAAVGVGFTWGHGTLRFHGKDYPFRLRGVDVLDVGGTRINATGTVYNLNRVVDFSGNYAAASAGAALTGGGAEGVMRNDRGVVIRMRSDTEGAQLKAAVEGVTIELEAPAQ